MTDKNDSPASAEPPAADAIPVTAAAAEPAETATKKRARWVTPALALVAALIVGGVGGVLIGQNTASPSNASVVRNGFGGPQAGEGPGTGQLSGNRGGLTAGTITSIDGSTITVKLADGSTVKVTTSDSTAVTKTSKAKVSDLATGDTITVIGQADSSGNVTATRISEGDAGFGGFVGGGARPSGAPTP
jgi:Domain of unknown function (DUF5666)